MAYSNISIKKLIHDISENKYYLPAIQRKFVWREEKICKLFNSIMLDYPIGTFLFWELSQKKANQYTFYEFLRNFHQRDSKNQLVRHDFTKDIVGVLDGQQRISSMYIALQGVYRTKRKHAKRADDHAYPERQFYMNLLGEYNEYEFKFLTDEAVESISAKYFYRVRDILVESENADPDEIIDALIKQYPNRASLLEESRKIARKNLNTLLRKFNDPQLINYFRIVEKDLDDILEIFVRVNSGGTVLSKSDLLFSTLVVHWEDGREHIEQLIDTINGQDRLFDFNTDFLMRTCLFLIDAPMTFKVQTFDRNNIAKIRDNWSKIVNALSRTSSLLRQFGFNKTRLSSNYAATPIAYYIYKGGDINKETKVELQRFVTNSLLKQVYSGQADSALSSLRDGLRKKNEHEFVLKSKSFSLDEFKQVKLPSGKKLTIDEQDIDEFLEHKKGPVSFLLLSALYPDLKLDQISFHQDHMHPASGFKTAALNDLGLSSEEIALWQSMRDQVPNLQLLEGLENETKQATPLNDWVESMAASDAYYRTRNLIPDNQSLLLKDFEQFFEVRKSMLKSRLLTDFKIITEQLMPKTRSKEVVEA